VRGRGEMHTKHNRGSGLWFDTCKKKKKHPRWWIENTGGAPKKGVKHVIHLYDIAEKKTEGWYFGPRRGWERWYLQ